MKIDIKEFQILKKSLMKLLIKNIFDSKFLIFLRNNLNIKKIKFNLKNIKLNASVSDSFCWRTDNDFETTFRFSDILKNFYKIDNSFIKLIFYNKNGEFLKEIKLENLNRSVNEIKINKFFLNGLEDYGTFHVYHILNSDIEESMIISNRCYTGFSRKKSLPSFMHGNTLSSYTYIENKKDDKIYSNIIGRKILKNSIYKIQNYFEGYDKTELFFTNPTNNKIKLFINSRYFEINKKSCLIVETKKDKIITIKSNCLFLRPVVFNYKNNYFDVFHA